MCLNSTLRCYLPDHPRVRRPPPGALPSHALHPTALRCALPEYRQMRLSRLPSDALCPTTPCALPDKPQIRFVRLPSDALYPMTKYPLYPTTLRCALPDDPQMRFTR